MRSTPGQTSSTFERATPGAVIGASATSVASDGTQERQRVVATSIHPARGDGKAVRPELLVQGTKVELDADFCQDLRASGKDPRQIDRGEHRIDVTPGAQPHLHAVLVGVPSRDVSEVVGADATAVELPSQNLDEVKVELGRDSPAVVVRRQQPVRVLDQVSAKKEVVTRRHRLPNPVEECMPFVRLEVADGAAEKRAQSPSASAGKRRKWVAELAPKGVDSDVSVAP